jgi:hypothetical protein
MTCATAPALSPDRERLARLLYALAIAHLERQAAQARPAPDRRTVRTPKTETGR